jgi:phosphoribosylanthranilate isomerase
MKIKICGLFREQDIEYVNEAQPDFIGFVFADSKRKVSVTQAEQLQKHLHSNIIPVGVFVNAPISEIASLYRNGIISIAQLHGNENTKYIEELKTQCDLIQIIKTIQSFELEKMNAEDFSATDYLLIDSGAGSGKNFNWEILNNYSIQSLKKKWFLAGGINLENIEEAISFNPFCIDVSSGAETSSASETDGVKDRNKILRLVEAVKNLNKGTQYE